MEQCLLFVRTQHLALHYVGQLVVLSLPITWCHLLFSLPTSLFFFYLFFFFGNRSSPWQLQYVVLVCVFPCMCVRCRYCLDLFILRWCYPVILWSDIEGRCFKHGAKSLHSLLESTACQFENIPMFHRTCVLASLERFVIWCFIVFICTAIVFCLVDAVYEALSSSTGHGAPLFISHLIPKFSQIMNIDRACKRMSWLHLK